MYIAACLPLPKGVLTFFMNNFTKLSSISGMGIPRWRSISTRTRVTCVKKVRYGAISFTFDTILVLANKVFADATLVPDRSTLGMISPPSSKKPHIHTHKHTPRKRCPPYHPKAELTFPPRPIPLYFTIHLLCSRREKISEKKKSPYLLEEIQFPQISTLPSLALIAC